jgi:hypothetical protein
LQGLFALNSGSQKQNSKSEYYGFARHEFCCCGCSYNLLGVFPSFTSFLIC